MPYGKPIITEDVILCEECGKEFKKITHCHLKTHNLTIPEYKERWGFCKNQPLEALYIKNLRKEYSNQYSSALNLLLNPNFEKNKFKKGQYQDRIISEQERIRLANMAVNVQHTDRFKKSVSIGSKMVWNRPGYKDKYRKMQIEKYKDKDLRERLSKQSKDFWSNVENRKIMSVKRKILWNTPEKKKYASERSKLYWKKKKNTI